MTTYRIGTYQSYHSLTSPIRRGESITTKRKTMKTIYIDNIEQIHNEMKWCSNSLDLRRDGVEITNSSPSYNREGGEDDHGDERTKNYRSS